jgi:hypothetical protein
LSSDRPFLDKFTELEKKLKDAANAFEELKQDTFLKDKESKNIHEQYDEIVQKLKRKEEAFTELENKYNDILTKFREIKQNELIASDIIKDSEKHVTEIHSEKENLRTELDKIQSESKEKDMEKILLEEMVDMEQKEKHIATKKYYKTVIVAAISIAIIAGVYSYMFAELAGQQYRVEDLGEVNSAYVIQNLRGDTVDTWLSWRLVQGDPLRVTILNGDNYPPEILETVKQTLISEYPINIDDSLVGKGPRGETSQYYLGWKGALAAAAQTPSKVYIPTNIELIDSEDGANITIILVDEENADGFTGWTVSIADDDVNQILKSKVTIFNVDELSGDQVAAITRHEFGHVMGLVHSSDKLDLMHPVIKTQFPYISECDVDAIHHLYDDGKSSQVECEK